MEEWNEYGEIKENLGAGSAADPLVPTPSAPSTPSKPSKSACAAPESTMLAATPPPSVQKPAMESHLTTAMRKAGIDAAKKAVDVKSQSRALVESKGSTDVDQDGAQKGANKSTTTGLKSGVKLKTRKAKGDESQVIASAEKLSLEEEDDEVDEKRAVSELKILPIRQKPQNLQEAGEQEGEEGDEDEDGNEAQDAEGADSRSQQLPTSKPASKTKKPEVDVDEEEGEVDEEKNGDVGRKKLPTSKQPMEVVKADEDYNDDEDEDDEDDQEDDDEDAENEIPSTEPVAAPPKPTTTVNDPHGFKTGGPFLDPTMLNPAKSKANKK